MSREVWRARVASDNCLSVFRSSDLIPESVMSITIASVEEKAFKTLSTTQAV